MIYQLALRNNERACIAGLHVLQQVMSKLGWMSFKSNDIDIFTSLYFDDENIKILKHKFQQLCSDHLFMIDKLLESRSRVDGMQQIWNIEIFGLQHTGNMPAV
jgi:predicted DNA-binding transcriptional regulator